MPGAHRIGIVLLIVLGLTGCSRAPWYEELRLEPAPLGEIKTSSRFGEEVYFGSQPEAGDFEILANQGIRTVLNLRTEAEMAELEFDEEAAAHAAGLNYLNIPIGREQPDDGTLELIHSIIDDTDRRPLLIHCASSNRVGYVWATYRGRRTGVELEPALEEGREAGMWSPVLIGWVRSYLGETGEAAEAGGSESAPASGGQE